MTLRLLGAVAFTRRCPNHAHLRERLGRHFTDIDFAAYGRRRTGIRGMLAGAGYVDDPHVYVGSEGTRLVAEHAGPSGCTSTCSSTSSSSVNCPVEGRLELDPETIPVAELLLQKMQIAQINEKDLIDTIMLLLEFPLGEPRIETINLDSHRGVCAKDWGVVTHPHMNVHKVRQAAAGAANSAPKSGIVSSRRPTRSSGASMASRSPSGGR